MKKYANNIKNVLKDNLAFSVILLFYICYYTYRLFAITPWYDEEYTYINMIDKGFLFSATHWPAPNNHVFFSMVSSLLKGFGVYIGLRGVSWLAAVGTLLFLYMTLKILFTKNIAVFGVSLYSFLLMVNTYAVQGRGYSLATFLLILAIYSGLKISYDGKKCFYIIYAIALYLGLYTLSSSLYWVLSICACFGILLLLLKKIRQLVYLVFSSLAAAFFTLVSYGVLWAFMGAQSIHLELPKFNSELAIIFEYPRSCVRRGIQIMISDPNLKSIDRAAFFRDFKYFFRDILRSFISYYNNNMFLIFSVIITIILMLDIGIVLHYKRIGEPLENRRDFFAFLISSPGFFVIYVILVVQSTYPFTRVFSFLGIYLTIMICLFLELLLSCVNKIWKAKALKPIPRFVYLIYLPIFAGYAWCIMFGIRHNQEYYIPDYYAYDAVKHVQWEDNTTYAASDVFSSQQVIFHIQLGKGMHPEETAVNPDYVILYKEANSGDYPFIKSAEELNQIIGSHVSLMYENDLYQVYQRKK